MDTWDQILEHAKRLPAPERRRLIEALLRLEDAEVGGEGPYARWLEAAGSAHSEHSDLSTDKYRHVGAAADDGNGEA